MKPQLTSGQGTGGKQQSGNTVPVSSIPKENRDQEGVKHETPEAAKRPGVTDPKVKLDRPGEHNARGLHR